MAGDNLVTLLLLTGGPSEHPASAIDRGSPPLIRNPLPVPALSALARNMGAVQLDVMEANVRRWTEGVPR